MAVIDHEVDIRVGRRANDGRVRVSIFAEGLLALSLEASGERAPAIILTLEQARKLQSALEELVPLAERFADENPQLQEPWQVGQERRTTGNLRP